MRTNASAIWLPRFPAGQLPCQRNLFAEGLYLKDELEHLPDFAAFYVALLKEVRENLALLSHYEKPTNPGVLEEFQKYISQASVESYAIKRRNLFLEKGFAFYVNPKSKGKIIGSGK